MDTVWIVDALFGKFDDIWSKVIGVYTSKELAEENKKKFVDNLNKWKNAKFRLDYSEMPGYTDDSKELWDEYDAWKNKVYDATEFTRCVISEFELNKTY